MEYIVIGVKRTREISIVEELTPDTHRLIAILLHIVGQQSNLLGEFIAQCNLRIFNMEVVTRIPRLQPREYSRTRGPTNAVEQWALVKSIPCEARRSILWVLTLGSCPSNRSTIQIIPTAIINILSLVLLWADACAAEAEHRSAPVKSRLFFIYSVLCCCCCSSAQSNYSQTQR